MAPSSSSSLMVRACCLLLAKTFWAASRMSAGLALSIQRPDEPQG